MLPRETCRLGVDWMLTSSRLCKSNVLPLFLSKSLFATWGLLQLHLKPTQCHHRLWAGAGHRGCMHSRNVNIFYMYTHRRSICNKYSLSILFAVCQIIDIIIDAAGFQKDTTGCVLNLAIRAHLSGPGIFGWVLDHCHPRVLLFCLALMCWP